MRIVHNKENCFGCKACVAACKDVNNMPPSRRLLQIETVEQLVGKQQAQKASGLLENSDLLKVLFQADTCFQCALPKCVQVCPRGALSKGEDGVVRVIAERCTGCGKCTGSCPSQAIILVNGKATKCELCSARKKGPACIEACPNGCLSLQ